MPWDETAYRSFFRTVNKDCEPYDYQVDVARRLVIGQSVALRAPTGAGKTAAVLTPFLFLGWAPRPTRLIYALPLRTLAQSIYREARELTVRAGLEAKLEVTIQTGEQPEDEFFDRGGIIVTTYDQVLSGLLDAPYGLSGKLHNVNAAAIAGALVVFDEFHLMEPQRAFLTGAAGLHVFRELAQSVWMTATATPPLVAELADALGAEVAGPQDDEVAALPSVKTVTRDLVWDPEPLEVADLTGSFGGRTIVITNTVSRAQALFRRLAGAKPDMPAILLHSRFFKADRREKEVRLRELFGKGAMSPALLVATQVVEAGADISCDHLHTELAPMNSLVQRAGRCARFEGEAGIVHVHSLPEEPRSWLPYGSLRAPDPAVAVTQRLLEEASRAGARLTPTVAAEWVSVVHGAADARALGEGWKGHLRKVRDQIRQSAILRQPGGASDLIREPATDELRVILAREATLPARPGEREAVTLNRWRLAGLVRDLGTASRPVGWFWDTGAEEPSWRPLSDPDQLRATYAVALDPAFARYTVEVGLEDGLPGEEESPPAKERERPGHKPLRAERWRDHVGAVADVARRRVARDADWLGPALQRRFGLGPGILDLAARAAGLAHDLGKLQQGWQEWAGACQSAASPAYRHLEPLAHTDFDSASPADRERERRVAAHRPEHAAASAFLGAGLFGGLLSALPKERRALVASACAAAVLAHHGGWLRSEGAGRQDLGIQPLWARAGQAIDRVFGAGKAASLDRLLGTGDRRGALLTLLEVTTGDESLIEYWPLVAYLTRALRLADQRATAEGGSFE